MERGDLVITPPWGWHEHGNDGDHPTIWLDGLEKMKRNDKWDACYGLKMKYTNPLTGDYAMPTMAAFIQLLPSSFMGKKYRSTDSTVFVCVEGEAKTIVDDLEISWTKNDTFVIPSWVPHSHNSYNSDAVTFSFSDRAIQQKCGLWRENRYGN